VFAMPLAVRDGTLEANPNDGLVEGTETVELTTSNPSDLSVSITTATATGDILDDDSPSVPTVTTTEPSAIMATTALSGGEVTDEGSAAVTARGVCWSASPDPTIADSHTKDGAATGAFTSDMTGLDPNTDYAVRAYVTNAAGTAYGAVLAFTTLPSGMPPVYYLLDEPEPTRRR